MKTLSCLIVLTMGLLSLHSCQEEPDMDNRLKSYVRNEPVKLNFYAKFSSTATSSKEYADPSKSGTWMTNVQSGTGIADCLGEFTFAMNCIFCYEGESCGQYENGCGSFTLDKGDKIFISFSGKATIFDSDHNSSGYAGTMEDKFTVTGGTGFFKNAAGEGVFKSCFTCKLARIDHVIVAEIILPPFHSDNNETTSVYF